MYTVPKPHSGSERGQEQPATISSETALSGPQAVPSLTARPEKRKASDGFVADGVFRAVVTLCAVALVAIVGLIFYELVLKSQMSLSKFGFPFLTKRIWDPVNDDFGALPFVFGTLLSSLVALVIAVPLSLGTALFLTELCPRRLRAILSLLVELLAAIPSVIYGLWGFFVLVPFLRDHIEPVLERYLGWTGIFTGPILGRDMLAAGVILAIMILPIISSITREVISAVPRQQREAALALGATKWEMLRMSVLRNARTGIFGAIILGLGRAFGETMAVTMIIGNVAQISKSLFAQGYTLASVIANEFSEAVLAMHKSALTEAALILFGITLVVNALAMLLVWSTTRGMPSRSIA